MTAPPLIDLVTSPRTRFSVATAYAPLPIDPDTRRSAGPVGADPRPAPSPPPPSGPAYPSLPTDPDTRGGKPGGTK